MLLFAGQRRDDIAQRRQALVDGRRLAQLIAGRSGFGETLASGQIEQTDFAADDGAVQPAGALDVDADDQMRPATAVVHTRRSGVARMQTPAEQVGQLGRVGDRRDARSLDVDDTAFVLFDLQLDLLANGSRQCHVASPFHFKSWFD